MIGVAGGSSSSCKTVLSIHCLAEQDFGQVLNSQAIVASSKLVRTCSPRERRWNGNWRTVWSMVCLSEPHTQATEGTISPSCKQECKRPTPGPRRLSQTHAVLGRPIPGGCRFREWKYGVSWCSPTTLQSIGNPSRAPHFCCCRQTNWWDVVRQVQMGVSIWGTVHS